MTSGRIQQFWRKYNNNISFFDGTRIIPRNITQRKTTLKIHKNHFCLIWKTQNKSFKKTLEDEFEPNFKVVDNVISDKHGKSFVQNECKPEKVQSQLTNMIVYEIENFNTDKAVPFANYIYRLSKISGK